MRINWTPAGNRSAPAHSPQQVFRWSPGFSGQVVVPPPSTVTLYLSIGELAPTGTRIHLWGYQTAKTAFFDATGYAGGIGHGIPKFSWANDFQLLTSGLADQAKVNAVADSAMLASRRLAIDIETLDLNADRVGLAQAQANAAVIAQVIDYAHQRQAGLEVGIWSPFPTSVDGFEHVGQIDVANWQRLNDLVAPYFVNRVDWIGALVYHAFDGIEGYSDLSTKMAAEMRRLLPGKPSYAVVFPFLNISGSDPSANSPIDLATWSGMLAVDLTNYDAITLWWAYNKALGDPPQGSIFDPSFFAWRAVQALL